jgi:single-stranded DNA-specific DHH superfamily exonuclease
MKTIKILILLVAMLLPTLASAQTRLFSDLSNDKNIKTVYVGKVMMSLATGVLGNSLGTALDTTVDISSIANKVNSVEVVSTEKKKCVKKIQKQLNKAIKQYNLQSIIDTPNGDNNEQILFESDDYNGTVAKLLIVRKEKTRMNVIVIQGNIELSDIIKQ